VALPAGLHEGDVVHDHLPTTPALTVATAHLCLDGQWRVTFAGAGTLFCGSRHPFYREAR
jgi:hypothetical protein